MSSRPCADCFSGTLCTGTPTGTVSRIHDFDVYAAHPEDGITPKGIIVMIPDAFGWQMPNNRLLCDAYAKKGGFLVYLPDFMNGIALSPEALPLMAKIITPADWLTTIFYKPIYIVKAIALSLPPMFKIRSSVCKPRVIAFFQALRSSPPPFPTSNLKIGAAGFCWGGQHTVFLCQNTPSSRINRHESQALGGEEAKIEALVDCGFTAHPSMLCVPGDIENVALPLSVAVGDIDMAMGSKDIVKMREILEVKKKGDHECVIMPGAKHGFAVRSHPDDKLQMDSAEKAELQALEWFSRWLM